MRRPVAFTISEDRDQQAALADDSPRLLVTSPPGSGKTLTAVQLIARDVDVGRIGPTQRVLVLTFSRNARAQLERYADMTSSSAWPTSSPVTRRGAGAADSRTTRSRTSSTSS